jgi:hypothetical protein
MNSIEEIIKDNSREYAHLSNVIGHSDDDLEIHLDAGWTVSAVLVHLAFWDQRAITLIAKWKKKGVSPSPIDTDVVNDAILGLCLAIPPRKAAELALTFADEVDNVIANLTPEMVEGIQTMGNPVNLRRADHRRTHLGEIERKLEDRRTQAGKNK